MKFHLIQAQNQIDEVEARIQQEGEVIFDLETTSLNTHASTTKIVGCGLGFNDYEAFYIPYTEETGPRILEIANNDTIAKIGHNIKYDARVINKYGGRISNIKFDTLLAHYCLYGDQTKHNLDDITLEEFGHVKIRTNEVIPRKSKGNPNPTMAQSPVSKVAVYCCEDIIYTYLIYKRLAERLKQNKSAYNLYYNIELPLLPVLIDMECNGVVIDKTNIPILETKIQEQIDSYKSVIQTTAKRDVILTNPTDIGNLLFEELKIQDKFKTPVSKTKTGKYRTNEDTLEIYKSDEVVHSILAVKKLNKLLKTYLSSFPTYISDYTGRLHTNFNQAIAVTGRLTSSEPNLQNQPARDALGKEIRTLYISRFPNGKILSADYSQAELRILAHMANEPVLIENYLKGGDAHLAVASKIYDRSEDKISKEERTYIKTINFGMIYGMGPNKLSMELNISKNDAKDLMNRYLGSMKGVKKFIQDSENELRANGFTETFFGRRRYIPKIYSNDKLDVWAAAREGTNHKVQGTNADMIKLSMIKIQPELGIQNLKSLLILQVHDELVLDTYPTEEDILAKLITSKMQEVVSFKVPIVVEAKFGTNWATAH